MKTNFAVDRKVNKYLLDAMKKSEEIRNERLVTSEYLLYTVLEDEDSLIGRYLSSEQIDYIVFMDEMETTPIFDDELLRNFYTKTSREDIYSREVLKILEFANDLSVKKGKEKIDSEDLSIALAQNENPIWKELVDDDGFDLEKMRDVLSIEKYLKSDIKIDNQPEKIFYDIKYIESDLTELELQNNKFSKDGRCVILGRNTEIEKVWITFRKMTTRNVILVGEAGVGKTAIVDGITERIVKGKCPKEFRNKKVVSLNIGGLLRNTKYRGEFEEKFNKLEKYLEENEDVILFIDEIHNVIGAGRTEESSYDFANALKPILTNGKVRVIGATTKTEYDRYLKKDPAFKRRFEVIEVKEPKSKELYKMLLGKIELLEQYHGVSVSKEIFETVVSEASGYSFDVANPSRTVDLLDTAMAIASSKGNKELDIRSILEVHKSNIKRYRKMDKNDLRSIAYHEVGHFILSKTLLSKWEKINLVSIIPADEYLGVNVFEINDEYGLKTKKDYINEIASNLAGDIASNLKGYEKNSGKSVDLSKATNIARDMILLFGMQDTDTILGRYNSYSACDYELLSDAQKQEIAKQTDLILKEAYELAEKILKREDAKLEKIVKALLKKGSLNEKELNELYSGKIEVEDLKESNIDLIK